MSRRRYLWLILAAGHLTAVGLGASSSLPVRSGGPSARMLNWYAIISGADSTFAFYAPNVSTPHRARFRLRDAEGTEWWDRFDATGSREADLRLGGVVDAAFMDEDVQKAHSWRNDLVRSWAAAMLRRHPHAVSVTVIVEVYYVPTVADYRAGVRPSWREIYRAEVLRSAPQIGVAP